MTCRSSVQTGKRLRCPPPTEFSPDTSPWCFPIPPSPIPLRLESSCQYYARRIKSCGRNPVNSLGMISVTERGQEKGRGLLAVAAQSLIVDERNTPQIVDRPPEKQITGAAPLVPTNPPMCCLDPLARIIPSEIWPGGRSGASRPAISYIPAGFLLFGNQTRRGRQGHSLACFFKGYESEPHSSRMQVPFWSRRQVVPVVCLGIWSRCSSILDILI